MVNGAAPALSDQHVLTQKAGDGVVYIRNNHSESNFWPEHEEEMRWGVEPW